MSKPMSLAGTRQGKGESSDSIQKPKRKSPDEVNESGRVKSKDLFDEVEDTDEDDEVLSVVESKGKSGDQTKFIILGVIVAVMVVALFLLFHGKKEEPVPDEVQVIEAPPELKEEPDTSEEVIPGVGTQDFTGNTNMNTSEVLTNPDEFLQDINGLTTRVDYTVSSITNISDFVSYTKHRGTWGGGLELYWLDAEYQGTKYVIQVPFKYYKELADEGIVPVSVEILTIPSPSGDENLHVASYMCLDEKVLKDVLKNQNK